MTQSCSETFGIVASSCPSSSNPSIRENFATCPEPHVVPGGAGPTVTPGPGGGVAVPLQRPAQKTLGQNFLTLKYIFGYIWLFLSVGS